MATSNSSASTDDLDSANFWKLEHANQAYWDTYLSTRPAYQASNFYTLMYDYHASHSLSPPPSFAVAHDIGTGPGQVAAQLASRFAHVVASDNNETSLDEARRRLSATSAAGRASFALSTGEAIASHYSAQSADFIAAAECFPLMNAKVALAGFAALLKPGGTLAIWFYGRPHFAEGEYATKCQPLLDAIMDHHFGMVIKGSGPDRKAGWKRAADGMASWLDYICFPAEMWKDVQRWKWNPQFSLSFFGPEACDFEIEPVSCEGEQDKVIEEENSEFWKNRWDAEGLRRFVGASFPPTAKGVQGEDYGLVESLYGELTEAMGGNGAVRDFTWPAVLILAARANS